MCTGFVGRGVWRTLHGFLDGLSGLRGLALSSGSACSSGSNEPSHVLKALGISDDLSTASIRIGFGYFTSDQEMDFAAESIAKEVYRQRINLGYRAPAA